MSDRHGLEDERRSADAPEAVDRPPRRKRGPLPVRDRALRLLAVRARSRNEIETRLRRAGYPEEEIVGTLEWLERSRLIDDELFAAEFAEHQFEVRRSGRRAVISALRMKGVPPDIVERAVEEHDAGEAGRALDLATRRASRLSHLPPKAAARRLHDFLLRRGYSPATARSATARALAVDDPDAD